MTNHSVCFCVFKATNDNDGTNSAVSLDGSLKAGWEDSIVSLYQGSLRLCSITMFAGLPTFKKLWTTQQKTGAIFHQNDEHINAKQNQCHHWFFKNPNNSISMACWERGIILDWHFSSPPPLALLFMLLASINVILHAGSSAHIFSTKIILMPFSVDTWLK